MEKIGLILTMIIVLGMLAFLITEEVVMITNFESWFDVVTFFNL